MISLLVIEIKKMYKTKILLVTIFFCLVGFLIGLIIYKSNQQIFIEENQQALGLWSQTLYYAQLFFPIMISVVVAINCNIEYQRNNWQRLRIIPISANKIVLTKFIYFCLVTLCAQLCFYFCYLFMSLILNFPNNMGIQLLKWTLTGWLGTFPIIAIQLYFSLRFPNFSTAVILATVGSFFGLFTIFISNQLTMIYPYTQILVGLRSRNLTQFTDLALNIFCISCLIWTVTGLVLSKKMLMKR